MLAYLIWDVSPVIAKLGPLTLRWYGLLFASGFALGAWLLRHIFRTEKVDVNWVDSLTGYMVVGTVLGARLGHCLFYDPSYYLAHPVEILQIWEGGLASHGATLGILLAVWVFSRRNQFDYLWLLDRIVIVVAIGGMCIRLGNLMNSEIVGHPTQVPWAFRFVRDPQLGQVPRHPTQIYEALFCLLLLGLLYSLWRHYRLYTPRGLLFGLFVVLLFSFRFGIEFLKENQSAFEQGMPLNMGQLLSLPLIAVGLWVTLRAGRWPANPYGYAPRVLDPAEITRAA
ncbi:prolipoprotein diacylglyceryl transferase [Hymenobacter lucidus]|uniref:Phosphatidylglycerol--prolipoprotein diacylglyceryl transferase n=1 Tax=Hymenobacter lucidus TaxID=2880930 RepID=A0ABS8AY33_9BACT|nr:prolipoprotein diacylglyceryl transferase [Hymenobacter lucidus]MCB2410722.1 prolipoprotein diacylglyceryl transferase [Hymenobacter lucidus]